MKWVAVLPLVVASATGVAIADESSDASKGVGLSLGLSTVGANIDLSGRANDSFDWIVGYKFLEVSGDDTDDDGNEYTGEIDFSGLRVGLQYYPFPSSGFRIEGGLMQAGDGVTLTGKPGSDVTYNGNTYTPAQAGTVTANVSYDDSLAPYLSLGWGRGSKDGFRFGIDVGVVMNGDVSAAFSSTCDTNNDRCEDLNADLDAEEATANEDFDDISQWPFLRLGVSYGF